MADDPNKSQTTAQALQTYLASVQPDEPFAKGQSPLPDDPMLHLMQDPFEWRTIPPGRFQTEGMERAVECQAFLMARYPITFPHFHTFILAEDGFHSDQWWAGLAGRPSSRADQTWQIYDHPRENVSWYEAVAFTRWLSNKVGYEVRLPTEWEWQWAAQGPSGRAFPWGNEYILGNANSDEYSTGLEGSRVLPRTTAVDHYPKSASEFGLVDLTGNVWEWCLNTFDDPFAVSMAGDDARSLRGGSFKDDVDAARNTARYALPPGTRADNVGLRVAAFAPPPQPRANTLFRR